MNETLRIKLSNLMIIKILEGFGTIFKFSKQNPMPSPLSFDGDLLHPNRNIFPSQSFCKGRRFVFSRVSDDLNSIWFSYINVNICGFRRRDLSFRRSGHCFRLRE